MLYRTYRVLLLHLQLFQPDRSAAGDYDLVRDLYPSLLRRSRLNNSQTLQVFYCELSRSRPRIHDVDCISDSSCN